ncbi:MAG: TraB/GumN family protein [Acidobacteriota bacterium]
MTHDGVVTGELDAELVGEVLDVAEDQLSDYPPEVQIVEQNGRRLVLVGTAHVSQESVELVRRVIEREQPDAVCVELDQQRYQALAEQRKWESLDVKEIIRRKQLTTLLVNLLLAAYQRRLGHELGVEPGRELLEATKVADELGVPVVLCDRDVRITLRRAVRKTPFFRRIWLLATLIAALFEKPDLTEEQLEELKQQDVLNELMAELGRFMPQLKTTLIDERDSYLATKILRAKGDNLVAVVGAGHLKGMRERIEAGEEADLPSLEVIPPASKMWKVFLWLIPTLILGSIAWIGYTQGTDAAGANISFWILANGIPAAIGAILALSHPLTILTAFLASPLTSLTPLIGASYVCAFVQVYMRPPTVGELRHVGQDIGKIHKWWSNRLLKVFLAFLLPGLGSTIGSWVGAVGIFKNLF